MPKKILFFIDASFSSFAVAYFLSKKYDCELYALVDITNKPKKFFESQKLVNFKKIWFFHDHMDISKKPDIGFLEEFEKKYDLNLWNLAINERIFYRFFNFFNFSREKILTLLEQSSKLFESILNEIKPNFFASSIPVFYHHELLTQISEKKGIYNLLLSMPKLAGKSMISKKLDQFDDMDILDDIKIKNKSLTELQNYLKKRVPDKAWKEYWTNQSKKNSAIKSKTEYLLSSNEHEKTHYTYFGRTKFNVINFTLKRTLQKFFRENFIKKNLENNIDLSVPYVYFPLSVDMERALLFDSPFYNNQLEIIRTIAKSIPVNYKLYVKENPAQASREWRSIHEYNEILKIPNVTLIQPSVIGRDLIKNSSLVISIAGTSPLEATFFQKPSIVFGKVIYNVLPSVYPIDKIHELPKLIKKALNTNVQTSDLDRFIELYEKNTIDFDLLEFETRFNQKFYYDGTLFDVNINESILKKFLDEHEDFFKDLISEYIIKLNSV